LDAHENGVSEAAEIGTGKSACRKDAASVEEQKTDSAGVETRACQSVPFKAMKDRFHSMS
jgi:hypothetical protein